MTFVTGRLMHKLLAPPTSEVTFLQRGFHAGDPQAIDYLEQIGCWFLVGLEYGMTVPGEPEISARLDTVPWEYRGFGYEGAAMALTILDGLLPAGGWSDSSPARRRTRSTRRMSARAGPWPGCRACCSAGSTHVIRC
jgi:hypothetical protein